MLFLGSAGLALVAFLVSTLARERRPRPTGARPAWSPRTGLVAIDALPVAWTAVTYFLGFDAGISVGSIGFGLIGQAFGFGVMWPTASAAVLLGLLGLVAARRTPTSAGRAVGRAVTARPDR